MLSALDIENKNKIKQNKMKAKPSDQKIKFNNHLFEYYALLFKILNHQDNTYFYHISCHH